MRLCLNCVKLLNSPMLELLDLSVWSNLFSECEYPFVDNPVVITEPAELSARLLGLGSKRGPSNKQLLAQKRSYSIHAYASLSLVCKNRDQVKERLC